MRGYKNVIQMTYSNAENLVPSLCSLMVWQCLPENLSYGNEVWKLIRKSKNEGKRAERKEIITMLHARRLKSQMNWSPFEPEMKAVSKFQNNFAFATLCQDRVLKWVKSNIVHDKSKLFWQKQSAQRGARTHDPEIKSLMLYRLS